MTAHVPSPLGKIAALIAGVTMLALATVAACTPVPAPTIAPTWTPVPTPSETPSPTATPTSTPSATRTPVPDPDVESGRIVRLTHTDYTKSDPDWSPDGSKIVFQCFDDGGSTIQSSLGPGTHGNHGEVRNWPIHFVWYPGEICVMNADGSSVKKLSDDQGDDSDPAWSPDGSTIAFSSYREGRRDILIMNADGSDVRRITDDQFPDYGPTWSPDGSRIAFSSNRDGSSDIYTIDADGSNLTKVTHSPIGPNEHERDCFFPAWSPDEQRIAFVANFNASSGIFVINPDGSDEVVLHGSGQKDRAPAWSPDSKTIVFASGQRSDSFDADELYIVNVDGSGLERLTYRTGDDGSPAWSPDGSKLAFVSERAGNPQVYVMVDFQTHYLRLTDNEDRDSAPAWSPDGARIAFSSDRDGDDEIYVVNADGSGLKQLTNNDFEGDSQRFTLAPDDYGPAWSPDGTRIAYQSSQREGYYDIFVMNEDGSGTIKLTSHEISAVTRLNRALSWSPDGTRIAFVANQGRQYQVYIMNSDGTQLTEVQSGDCQTHGQIGRFDDTGVDWSPDGTKLAFSCLDPFINIVSLSDGTKTALWACHDPVSATAWSPDGSRIAFTCHWSGMNDVYVINVSNGDVTRVTKFERNALQPSWSPDGTKIAISTDWDWHWDYEIYVLDLERAP